MVKDSDDALRAAQERAGVQVRALTDLNDLDVARGVFDTVWPSQSGSSQVQANLLRALVHAGGYASAAYRDGVAVGAAMGFVGRHRAEDGRWHEHLHSHMAAVLEPYRNQHVGSALKLHQRAWCLDQGLDTVVWTFDPLVRRNAIVNLTKLGTDVEGYEIDFYGAMDDAINVDDPTDRMFAWWRLDSDRARAALDGPLPRLDVDGLRDQGRDVRQVALPHDVVALREADRAAARRWRVSLRTEMLAALADGYRVVGMSTTDGYVLERKP